MQCPKCANTKHFQVNEWRLQSERTVYSKEFDGSWDCGDQRSSELISSGIYHHDEAKCLDCYYSAAIELFTDDDMPNGIFACPQDYTIKDHVDSIRSLVGFKVSMFKHTLKMKLGLYETNKAKNLTQ